MHLFVASSLPATRRTQFPPKDVHRELLYFSPQHLTEPRRGSRCSLTRRLLQTTIKTPTPRKAASSTAVVNPAGLTITTAAQATIPTDEASTAAPKTDFEVPESVPASSVAAMASTPTDAAKCVDACMNKHVTLMLEKAAAKFCLHDIHLTSPYRYANRPQQIASGDRHGPR